MPGLLSAAEALVTVKLLLAPVAGANLPVRVGVEARLNVAAGSSPAVVVSRHLDLTSGAEGSVAISISPGAWTLQAVAEGYWSPPHMLQVSGDATPAITLRLYPTGQLSQSIEGLPGGQGTVDIDFRGVPQTPADGRIPEGFVTCPVEANRLACAVPAGRLDLRFNLTGFIPEYLWSHEVVAGRSNTLPLWRLSKGASLTGFVRTANHQPSGGTVVELLTMSGDRIESDEPISRTPTQSEREPGRLQVTTNSRGFFQFRNIPVGEFQLAGRRDALMGLASARVEMNRETRLRDFLILEPPRELDVVVEPSVAPDGTPWTLRVVRLQPSRQPLHQRIVRVDRPTKVSLNRGVYSLEVWNARDRWFIESVTIEDQPPPVVIRLPITRVRGELTLGGEPLTGRVVFGGINGPMQISMSADLEGRFEGALPHDGDWVVAVEAHEPPVQRTLARVPVVRNAATGEAEVSIELPDTTLRGRVVDEAGRAVRAFVNVIPAGGSDRAVQVRVEPDESFVVRGLPEGEVRLEAEAEGGRKSDLATVRLAEGEKHQTILVVKGELIVEVRLHSAEGVPLAGGSIFAFEGGLHTGSRRYMSDATGRVTLSLRPGTRDIVLVYWADGYATRISSAVVSDEPISLSVDRHGASLVLDFGREVSLFDAAAPFQPVLSSGGAHLPIAALYRIAARRGVLTEFPSSDALRTVVLPLMNSGTYALCVQTRDGLVAAALPLESRCKGGPVGPGGELRLELEPQSWPTVR